MSNVQSELSKDAWRDHKSANDRNGHLPFLIVGQAFGITTLNRSQHQNLAGMTVCAAQQLDAFLRCSERLTTVIGCNSE